MSIASEISRIQNNIASAYTACENKGATLPQTQNSANLANTISNIPASSASLNPTAEPNDVEFIDYDGTIRYSYSASDFANLSALPDNPTHEGLIAQGWNWTLADAKSYVANYGYIIIGQMYVTDDNKTRIYVKIKEFGKSPYLGFAISGTAIVDWGDGTTSTVTGTGTSVYEIISTQHFYTNVGNYIITISSENQIYFLGKSNYGSTILWDNISNQERNRISQNEIYKIELGNNIVLGDGAFKDCGSLISVTMPQNLTSIGGFLGAYALKGLVVPKSVTSIPSFQNCYSLIRISLPKTTSSLTSFNSCYSLKNITIPDNISSLGGFQDCASLERLVAPASVTTIQGSCCSKASSLSVLIIKGNVTKLPSNMVTYAYSFAYFVAPSNLTTIESQAFYYIRNCKRFDFSKLTIVPTLENTNVFSSTPDDCQIIVPDDLYDTWISATNWSTYASKIVKASEV